ncbi:MAG: hypothetical protein Q9167_005418 [Letrouitia subvulpina]
MPQVDLSRAEFYHGSYQFPPGRAPWDSDKACSFYNTSQCLKPDCKFNHYPDHRSLRLVLDGPNICKSHLIGEHGCEFAKKEGRKCWYSHDLTKAALPLHDKDALREHLISAEAHYHNTYTYDDLIAKNKLEKRWKSGVDTGGEYSQKSTALIQECAARSMKWYDGRAKAAKKTLERYRQTGKIEATDDGQSKTPVLDVKGLSGADILRLCGVEKPFVKQRERKAMEKLGLLVSEVCDEPDGWETEEEWIEQAGVKSQRQKGKGRNKRSTGKRSEGYTRDDMFGTQLYPFSGDDMFELACQGIKPWEDDAANALMALNGGF